MSPLPPRCRLAEFGRPPPPPRTDILADRAPVAAVSFSRADPGITRSDILPSGNRHSQLAGAVKLYSQDHGIERRFREWWQVHERVCARGVRTPTSPARPRPPRPRPPDPARPTPRARQLGVVRNAENKDGGTGGRTHASTQTIQALPNVIYFFVEDADQGGLTAPTLPSAIAGAVGISVTDTHSIHSATFHVGRAARTIDRPGGDPTHTSDPPRSIRQITARAESESVRRTGFSRARANAVYA